jgi:ribosomal protein S18 acetylase RimI-like enzyme
VAVRPAEARDHAAIHALAGRLAIGSAPWLDSEGVAAAVRAWVADDLAEPAGADRLVLVAETAEVVGFACASTREHWSGEPRCYLGELVVAEEAEGQGIGRLLVTTVIAWAKSRGLRVELDTGATNTAGRAFYTALGFREEAVRLVAVDEPLSDRDPHG